MGGTSTGSVGLRRRLVDELEQRGVIRDAAVARAFRAVPREAFLREFAAREGLEAVYRDQVILTTFDGNGVATSSSSQPAVMAEMLQQLGLVPGMRVLEVGAGTGYNAALLSVIVGSTGRVTAVDLDFAVARGARAALRRAGYRARVVVGDGYDGYPADAPYDRIVVTASTDVIPRAWFDQLVDGGLIEVPVRITAPGDQVIATLRKTPRGLVTVAVVPGYFMPLRAADGSPPGLSRPPSLVASDGTAARTVPPLRVITGHALASLSVAAKRRLLSVALSEPRRERLRRRAETDSLFLYLALSLPPARAVRVGPGWTIGLISRDGSSLAYLEATITTRGGWTRSLTAHGGTAAATELHDAIRAWEGRGRPWSRRPSLHRELLTQRC